MGRKQDWEYTIRELGRYAYDHLWSTDRWFRKLSEQAVEISGIVYLLIPEAYYVHHLRKRFREIPEPYITHAQLVLILSCCSVVRNKEKYARILELYKKHFPVESASSVPRSLKHLSRCAVRDSLKSHHNLPEGIYELDLPATLIDYLDLKED